MTNYQKRMSRFIQVWGVYSVAGAGTLAYLNPGVLAWVVFVSTIVLLCCLAIGLDAVYDSLKEEKSNL
jgi:hypothetical protein